MSEFLTEGTEPFPNIYEENKHVCEYSGWTKEALMSHFQEYTAFLEKPQMPRAKEGAERILLHLAFEIGYRSGFYGEQND